jgi:hypothetical protein
VATPLRRHEEQPDGFTDNAGGSEHVAGEAAETNSGERDDGARPDGHTDRRPPGEHDRDQGAGAERTVDERGRSGRP